MPRLLPVLALPLLLDVLVTATGKILGAATGGRRSVGPWRNFSHRIDGAAAHDENQLSQPNANRT